MNHLNGLVLESICNALQPLIEGQQIKDCYSNSPDEFILEFEAFHIKLLFYKGEVFFFFNRESASKSRLFKPQFSEIHLLNIEKVVAHPFERSFHLVISNDFKLVFKCHGRKSNVILMHQDSAIDMFRNHLEKDLELRFDNLQRSIDCTYNVEALKDESSFSNHYPYLPSELFHVLKQSNQQEFDTIITKYRQLQSVRFDEHYQLFPDNNYTSILDAINVFSATFLKSNTFKHQREELVAACKKAISEKESFIFSNQKALETLISKRPEGEFGNIILANMHLFKPGEKSIVMLDIYHNTDISIALDPDLNAVENAEKYFKKEKSLPHAIKQLETKIAAAESTLKALKNQLEILEASSDFKSLKPLVKQAQKSNEVEQLPYRKFEYEGFDILVGKHADSNEKLLNYYSDKNDLWLHAKDVSGSHVIIKLNKNSKLPNSVLEKAASYAAYYSKNRKQQLVTVTYTQRKFVRKIKGAEKGKVTVSNEKTILVNPSL